MHGNNKSVAELEQAVAVRVGSIVVDSFQEIERLAAVAEAAGVVQPVLIRVNSGVHAETHDFLATAHEDQKFGFTLADAALAAARVREIAGLRLIGLHCHIGSQIFGTAGFAESAARIVGLYADLQGGTDARRARRPQGGCGRASHRLLWLTEQGWVGQGRMIRRWPLRHRLLTRVAMRCGLQGWRLWLLQVGDYVV